MHRVRLQRHALPMHLTNCLHSLQATHGMELVPLDALSAGTVLGSLGNHSTLPGLNTSANALYFSQQLAASGTGNPDQSFPTHVSPADLILVAPSPIFHTSCGSSSHYASPSTASSYVFETPSSSANGLPSDPISPAESGSEWAMYSPSGSSSAAGPSSLHNFDSSPSSSSTRSIMHSMISSHSTQSSDASAERTTSRRGRPTSRAPLSIPPSLTFSSSPGKVRAAAPRNKQVRFEPYEVPEGEFDHFACPHCEPGRAFAVPRRGRRKHDIERHLKTHFSEASRSESSRPQVSCDRIVPIEDIPSSKPPKKWWECGGRKVVGGCGKVFGREDSLLRHLKVGCRGPNDHQ